MKQEDIDAAVKLIREWSTRLPKTPLVWSQVEKRTGFTRPALAAKKEIRQAYDEAKAERRTFNGTPMEFNKLKTAVQQLTAENKRLRDGEDEWLTTWQRVVHHLHEMGIDPSSLLAPISSAGRRHTGETLAAFRGERQAKYQRDTKGRRSEKRKMDEQDLGE
jgi:hypothetical protein